VNAGIAAAQNGITQQMYANQIADLERSFAAQTANTQGMNALQSQLASCCCDNRLATANLQNVVQSENCADRTAAYQNTRDIIDSQTRGTQAILDKLCQLELDGVKQQVDAKNDRILELQNQLNQAVFRESQASQNALFAQGMNNEVDALYNRLKNCPVGTTPVYGNQPIFTCNQGGCGCGNGFAN
jgi:small-conductance mechanosensitive channel